MGKLWLPGIIQRTTAPVQTPLCCVIGLGANLGDRQGTLEAAVRRLTGLGNVLDLSHLYLTSPIGGPAQSDFFNAAVLLQTRLTPRSLLNGMLTIEQELGRERHMRWGPRSIDLDLLWIDSTIVHEPGLDVPHPRLLERAFAVFPLVDVAPEARDPQSHQSYADLRDQLRHQGIRICGRGRYRANDWLTQSPPDSLWQIADLRL